MEMSERMTSILRTGGYRATHGVRPPWGPRHKRVTRRGADGGECRILRRVGRVGRPGSHARVGRPCGPGTPLSRQSQLLLWRTYHAPLGRDAVGFSTVGDLASDLARGRGGAGGGAGLRAAQVGC